ncbi:MAG: hypothetical protein CSA83_01515, partial [Actinomycetales bacterium]
MKYGIYPRIMKLLLSGPVYKTIKQRIPGLLTRTYKNSVDKEYRRIIERTDGIGGIKNNPLEMILIFAAFAIAIYKSADGKINEKDFDA